MMKKINSKKEYEQLMKDIEEILQKATYSGGFENLSTQDKKRLQMLSLAAEKFEDSIPLMPIKEPQSLEEMLKFKMYEQNLKQKQMASILGISEAFLSGLLNGKRKLTIELAKQLHLKFGIDAKFLLLSA